MSYKDFSQLNAAVSQCTLDPVVSVINRVNTEMSEMFQMGKSLPVDWARAYAGVMVLKYASDGTPTDVTDTVTVHGSDAPNSLITDVKRRFYDVYDRYEQDISMLNESIPISTIKKVADILPYVDRDTDLDKYLFNIRILTGASNAWFSLVYNEVDGNFHFEITTNQPRFEGVNPDLGLGFAFQRGQNSPAHNVTIVGCYAFNHENWSNDGKRFGQLYVTIDNLAGLHNMICDVDWYWASANASTRSLYSWSGNANSNTRYDMSIVANPTVSSNYNTTDFEFNVSGSADLLIRNSGAVVDLKSAIDNL